MEHPKNYNIIIMPYTKISEYAAKKIFSADWPIINTKQNINDFLQLHKLCIIKVDQFIKRRGKNGLIKTNITSPEQVSKFIQEKSSFQNFILEKQINISQEKYFCILIENKQKKYIFNHNGGIDCNPYDNAIITTDLVHLCDLINIPKINSVLEKLDTMFDQIFCNMLEVNPLIEDDKGNWMPIDFAVEVDSCSVPFWNHEHRQFYLDGLFEQSSSNPTENAIANLDKSSGASLKFKILNPDGNILTLIAGGGASVLFTDAIVNRGMAKNLFNYGEYSGNPSKDEVFQYCNYIFESWFSNYAPNKKLIIGGGISNFTDVAATFKGIISAIENYKIDFHKHNVQVFVRRGGVNEKQGLALIESSLTNMNIPIKVFGTETPITQVVINAIPDLSIQKDTKKIMEYDFPLIKPNNIKLWNDKVIFVGNHTQIIQRLIDYDYFVGKQSPDIICIYDEFTKKEKSQMFFWGSQHIHIPITNQLSTISNLSGNYSLTVYNYASIRSCIPITKKLAELSNAQTFYVIAEGIPEKNTIELSNYLTQLNKTLLGPSSVGAIKSGGQGKRIGSVGGLIDNIKRCHLATPGNIAVITKSGGLLNEMLNFISNMGLSIGEAVSIGGDRYSGITFVDLINYYEHQSHIELIVLLGETGGTTEVDAANWWNKYCKKRVIAWCSGTSEKSFGEQVEFGHAGASANSELEEATNKNTIMQNLGFIVPDTFEEIYKCFEPFLNNLIIPFKDGRQVPDDLSTAIKNGNVRVNPNFITQMTDERTDLQYRKEPIDKVVNRNFSLGYTIATLWLNIQVDEWAAEFIEKSLTIMADHGPAVSGAQNTIITARAGKGLVESLVAGLLTIGPKFGGAVADAGKDFYKSFTMGETPPQFVARKKKEGSYIMGIGHRIKSKFNPDKRVEVIKELVKKFPNNDVFNYAMEIEKETLTKKANLILNVDGAIGAALIDICKYYNCTNKVINNDLLNGFFVVARTIGFIGHYNENTGKNLFRANTWDVKYE